jgi:hypothetical protein
MTRNIKTILIILVTVLFSLFVFVLFLNYPSFYDEYNIYAFKPSNAPNINEKIIDTKNDSSKQQQYNEATDSLIDTKTTSPKKDTTSYHFVKSWGSEGTGKGEFNTPCSIAVDSSTGNVYVGDAQNNRIQKFTDDGEFITSWGSEGTEKGEFNTPCSIAVDSSGNVYVGDELNFRIQKFDSDGNFITEWKSRVSSIVIDSVDNVYVLDTKELLPIGYTIPSDMKSNDNRIKKFDSNGNFITQWGSWGHEDGQFFCQCDIAVDSSTDNVYVAGADNRIQKFDSNGNFITKIISDGLGFAIDFAGNFYLKSGISNITKVTSNGNFITEFGLPDSKDNSFIGDIAVDSSTGNVYITENFNNRILVFAPSKN